MIEAILIFALICGGLSIGYSGCNQRSVVASRTPAALMLGVAFGSALAYFGQPVTIPLAITADIVIMSIILATHTTWPERLIVALFFAAWVFYTAPEPMLSIATTLITSAQLLLTVPWQRAWRRTIRTTAHTNSKDEFDLRVSGGEHGS